MSVSMSDDASSALFFLMLCLIIFRFQKSKVMIVSGMEMANYIQE